MKIICIGRNYPQSYAEENSEISSEPLFFLKPDTSLLRNNDPFYIPDFTKQVGYECNVVVKISRVTKCIEERFAHRCYDEIGLGIDFTAKDLQRKCIEKGLPWEVSKTFDHSAAISPQFIDKKEVDINNLRFECVLNNVMVQQENSANMLFSVDKIISYISQYMTLKIGDLIFTGTPVGAGTVAIGDRLLGRIEGREMFDFDIK